MKRTEEFSAIDNLLKVFSTAMDIPGKRTRNAQLTELLEKIKKAVVDSGGGNWDNYLIAITPFVESKIRGIKYHEFVAMSRK